MCGHFAAQRSAELIRRIFAATGDFPNLAANWNVAPTQADMVVPCHPETGKRRLNTLRRRPVPHSTTDLKAYKRPINAQPWTMATSGMFRGALASRQCLVQAKGPSFL